MKNLNKAALLLTVCGGAVLVAGCGGRSEGEVISAAMGAAMAGCNAGSTARLEVFAKTWNKGIVFTCEWVVAEDSKNSGN